MKPFVTFLFVGLSLFSESILSGQTIDTFLQVDQHRLHFRILPGEGTPILFEAGNGDSGEVWTDLLEPIQVETGATLITYDRAGLGASEIDTSSVGFVLEVEQLEEALKRLGFKNELIVVNHSFGAVYSTLLAYRKKFNIKGMVFIDPALPCFFTPNWAKTYRVELSAENWDLIKEHRLGLYHVLKNLDGIAEYMLPRPLPAEIRATLIAAEQILPMVKAEEVQAWKDCMSSFGMAQNRRYVLAKAAGHKVWIERPDIVIQQITQLYTEVKNQN